MVETDDQTLLETDESMEMEAELDKIEEQLNLIKMNEFRIGTQNFTLNHEEAIFSAGGAKKETKELSDCGTCKIVSLNKKTMVFCQFCGDANCKECCNKTRFYPKARLDGNG